MDLGAQASGLYADNRIIARIVIITAPEDFRGNGVLFEMTLLAVYGFEDNKTQKGPQTFRAVQRAALQKPVELLQFFASCQLHSLCNLLQIGCNVPLKLFLI